MTIPLVVLSGYAEMIFDSSTTIQALWTAVIGLPSLVIGLGLLLIPTYLKFDDKKSQVTIIKLLRKIAVPYDQIKRFERMPATFARIHLKSGENFIFILEDKDSYRISTFALSK